MSLIGFATDLSMKKGSFFRRRSQRESELSIDGAEDDPEEDSDVQGQMKAEWTEHTIDHNQLRQKMAHLSVWVMNSKSLEFKLCSFYDNR